MGILKIISDRLFKKHEQPPGGINYLNLEKSLNEESNIFGLSKNFNNISLVGSDINTFTNENNNYEFNNFEKDLSLNQNDGFMYVGESDKQILREFDRLTSEKAEKIIEYMDSEYPKDFTEVVSSLNPSKHVKDEDKFIESPYKLVTENNSLKEKKIKNLKSGKCNGETLTTVELKYIPSGINLGMIEIDEKEEQSEIAVPKVDKVEKISKTEDTKTKDNDVDIHSYEFESYQSEVENIENKFQMSITDYELYKYYQKMAEDCSSSSNRIYPMVINRGFRVVEFIGYAETNSRSIFEPTIVDIRIVRDKSDIPFLYGIIFEQLFYKFGRFKIDLELARELKIVTALSRVLQCPCEDGLFYFGYLSNSIVQRLKQRKYPELNIRTKNKYNTDKYLPDKNRYKAENGYDQMTRLSKNYEDAARVKKDKLIIDNASKKIIEEIGGKE